MSIALVLLKRVSEGLEAPPNAWIAGRSYYVWLVVAMPCTGAFIGQLDASIVQLALPVMEREFDAGLSAVSWVAISYLLGFCAFLPPFSRLSETVGRKRLYICGYLLFTAASGLCGFAPDLPSLIALRLLQGVGGALLGANGIAIMVKMAGPDRQGRALGLFAAAQAVGLGVGPAAGGLLIHALSWHWVFWATVPFGLVAAILSWLVLPQTPRAPAPKAFDWRGAFLLGPALTVILIVLSEAQGWGATSPYTLIAVAVAVVLATLFARQEDVAPSPLISLSLLRRPAFAAGIVGVLMSYAMLYGMFLLMSFAFVRGAHQTPLEAGLRMAILTVALGLTAPVAGVLTERIGTRVPALGGMAACITALGLMAEALHSGDLGSVYATVALVLFGVGLGLYISPNNVGTLSAAPPESAGVAAGLLGLLRVFGVGVGVAAASSVLSWRLADVLGGHRSLSAVPAEALFRAAEQALVLLAGFATVAAIASLVGPPTGPVQTRRR